MATWSPPPGWFGVPPTEDAPPVQGWWALIHGNGYLSSEGTLVVSASAGVPAAANLAGAGALAADAYAITPATLGLSGSGDLESQAYAVVPAVVLLSGAGSLASQAFEKYSRAADLTGAGSLSSTAKQQFQVPVEYTGAGNLATGAIAKYARAAALAGDGVLESDAYAVVPGLAIMTGDGQLTGAVYAIVPRNADMSGGGVLSASAFEKYTRNVPLTGTGALAASALQRYLRNADLTGAGALAATPTQLYLRTPALTGSGALAGSVIQQFQRTPALSGAGVLAAVADVISADPVAYRTSAVGSENFSGATASVTPSTDDSVVAFVLNGGTGDITNCVYGASNLKMKCRGQIRCGGTTSGSGIIMAVYTIDKVAAGAATITATCTGSNWCQVIAGVYTNVKGYAPTRATMGQSSSSLSSGAATVPGTGGRLVNAFSHNQTITSPSGGTSRINETGGFVKQQLSDSDTNTTFTASSSSAGTWGGLLLYLRATKLTTPHPNHVVGTIGGINGASTQTLSVMAFQDDYVYADLVANGSPGTVTAKCDGVDMVLVSSVSVTGLSGGTGVVNRYRSATRVASDTTVSVAVSITTGIWWAVVAASISGITTIGSTYSSTYGGSNSKPSQAITLAAGEYALHLFSLYTAPGYITGATNYYDGMGSSFAVPVLNFVDASATVTESLTRTQWGSLYTILS